MAKTQAFKNQKGFTLIELLVVMGILAVLLAIVLIAINPARQFKQANNRKRQSDVSAILNAYGAYAADHQGSLPSGINATPAEMTAGDCTALVSTYISALPVDPTITTGPISSCPASGSVTTQYWVSVDSNKRVTVTAEKTDTDVETPSVDISVTR
jgi:type IV pilus assembly protein PilA